MLQAQKDIRKLVACHAVVREEDAVHQFVVEVLAGNGDAFAVALAQLVVLETERLAVDLVEDGEGHFHLLLALSEVLHSRVLALCLEHEGVLLHVKAPLVAVDVKFLFFKFLLVLNPIEEILADVSNSVCLVLHYIKNAVFIRRFLGRFVILILTLLACSVLECVRH